MDGIHRLYQNTGYWSKYGGDVFITFIIIGFVFFIVGQSTYQSIILQIKNDWVNKRCNPFIMPFAGIIMPVEDESTFGTTSNNFNYCIQSDASMILKLAMMPVEFLLFITVSVLDLIFQALVAFIQLMAWLRSLLGDFLGSFYEKLLKFITPIMLMILHIRDIASKMNGIITTVLYTVMNIYNITVSGALNILNIIMTLLLILISVIVALIIFAFIMMFLPFVSFIGVAALQVAIGIISITIIPFIVLYIIMNTFNQQVLHAASPPAPSAPGTSRR